MPPRPTPIRLPPPANSTGSKSSSLGIDQWSQGALVSARPFFSRTARQRSQTGLRITRPSAKLSDALSNGLSFLPPLVFGLPRNQFAVRSIPRPRRQQTSRHDHRHQRLLEQQRQHQGESDGWKPQHVL